MCIRDSLIGFDRVSQVNKGNRFSRLNLCFQFVNGRRIVDNPVNHVFVLLGGLLGSFQGIFPLLGCYGKRPRTISHD